VISLLYDRDILLSEKVSAKLSEIGQLYFDLNRVLDAGSDYMEVDMNMNKLGNYIHHSMAHYATDPLADNFRDYLSACSRRTNYNVATKPSEGNYSSPLEFFKYVLNFYIDIRTAISDGIKLALAEDDEDTAQFLREQLVLARAYRDQFVLFCDKCEIAIAEGDTWQTIDNHWEDYQVFKEVKASDDN
jgi:ferritin